jgi:PAS domain S-box-containing protein
MPSSATPPEAGVQPRRRKGLPPEIAITVLYMFFGSMWIVGSDQLLGHVSLDEWDRSALQSTKGLFFIVATSLLLFLTLYRSFSRHRHAEEALHLSYERFELTARVTTDAIYDWDIAADHLWWNDGFYSQFGYARNEVDPKRDFWVAQLHPEEKEAVVNSLRAAMETGRDTWSCEYRFRRKGGGYAFVQDRACVVRDRGGRALRMIGGMSDITERKEGQEKLEKSRRQLRALSAHLQSLREEERTRIAREVHDELGQLLTALKMDVRWIEKRIGERENDSALLPVLDKAVQAGEVADRAIVTVQQIASELRPSTLDNLGLVAALRHESGAFHNRTGIVCEVRLPEEPLDLPRVAATAVFRVFQETLTNVARHAHATRVRVQLRAEGDHLVLEVEDNGRGISPEALSSTKSLGLLGMEERAAVLGGQVMVTPAAPHGTRVTLRLPRAADDTGFWEQLHI